MASPFPQIAVLAARGALEQPYPQTSTFHDPEALLAAGPWDVLLLDLPGYQAGQLLRRLRGDENCRYLPIYCCRDLDDWCLALGDGAPPADFDALVAQWRLSRGRFALFNRGVAPERFDSRVLAWLWMRGAGELRALRDTSVARHYRYPLLEVLAGEDPVNDFVWLQLMTKQGWLQAGELVDRLRLCSSCGSGRLNYVDVCPECGDLDIARQPSLHCFTCGHVAPQEQFVREGLLLCPNCLTRLRHIGSDYDRPMENYGCHHCHAFFVDARIEARCLDCGQVQAPDRLRVREVRHYQLTDAGRLHCRQGLGEGSRAEQLLQRLNLRGDREFLELLNWQIEQVRRYGGPPFSLLGIRLRDLGAAPRSLSEMRAMALLDSLVERLLETVRETDRCSRAGDELFWMLLPQTDTAGLARLLERLSGSSGLLGEAAAHGIELGTLGFTAPKELLEQEDGPLLLARLAGELE